MINMALLEAKIGIDVFQDRNGICAICGKTTEVKSSWINGNTGEKTSIFFDLCESCKIIRNCFTCEFSKPHFMRYKGLCDVNWREFSLYRITNQIDEAKEENDVKEVNMSKKIFRQLLKHYRITDLSISVDDARKIIHDKTCEEIAKKRHDCNKHKHRQIGITIAEYWNDQGCADYVRGEATKKEFNEANCDC